MDSPQYIHLIGKGTFLFDGFTIESSFSLYRNPYIMRIVMEDVNKETALSLYGLLCSGRTAQLTGIVNDGMPINASALQLRAINEFSATEGLSFGQARDITPTQSRYPLTGYFDGALTLLHSGWNIETIPCTNPDAARELAKNWRIPVEGTVLQLRREDSTTEQHRDFARIIMILLSIASGTGVSCDRHFFTWDSDELEIWRYWTGDEIGPGPIVPDFEVVRFLEHALSAWQSLTQEQREALSLARDYINLSALGYLDTRLFRILQPWEFLAKAWGIQGDLSNPEAYLRAELRKTNKKWNENYPNSDNYGYWGSRITSIFDWPKLRDAVGELSARFGLNLREAGLDLDLLKKARDGVAHSGKLPINPGRPNRQSLDLLTSGQYCLQLLLLRILAYQGKVYHSTGGVRTIVDIDEALTKVRT
jgi:hypothetical protein